jgi:hypothetical protein
VRPGQWLRVPAPARHTGVVTADQLELISTDPRGRYGRALIAGTGVRVAAPDGPGLAREELFPLPQSRRQDDER